MHHFRHEAFDLDKLWIIAVVSNPARYRSRYDLFKKFEVACKRAGANLMIVETAFGGRPYECVEMNHPNHLKLRTSTEIWHKENMINLGIERLPTDWKYVAWIDADIEFMRQDWVEEIVHQLQHYQVIQLFQHVCDLGPMGEVMHTYNGFVYSWEKGLPPPRKGKYGSNIWHPGYAWAARREAIDELGGLFDHAILGAADHHMAWALVGQVLNNTPKEINAAYKRELKQWEERAQRHIRQNIGYMPGSIFHHFHGKKKDRKYNERWKILTKWNFNPDEDIQRDWQGLYVLSDKGLRMRNDIRRYFHERNEDSIDL